MTYDEDELEAIRAARRRWREATYLPNAETVEAEETRETLSGLPVDPCAGPDDRPDFDYLEALGFPGEPPLTRGVYPTMYRGRLWTMRQYAGFGTAEETNRRFQYLLEEGQTGLSVAFDLPTQMGFDPGHPKARGEVGRVGVSVASREDASLLLEGLPLDRVSTSMTINATAMILLALYASEAERRGVPRKALRGTVQNDILKEYAARGTYIYPVEPAMKVATDVIAWCSRQMPRWNPISISGYHMREAGCNAVQEVAFTLGNAIAYVERVLERGLDVDAFAPRLSFFFAAQMDLLEEVAKFRAARRLWARIVRDRFGARDDRSLRLRFHTQTAGAALTAQQPYNNVVRVALQALAAVLGGTQSLHANSMDEALALPTEASARLALRSQQVLAHESGVAHTVDPVAGAFHVERLTEEIEARAERYLARIDQLGGMVRALERGFVQREIADEAYRAQLEVERGRRSVVGVNVFEEEEAVRMETLRLDPALEERRVRELEALRGRRDGAAADRARSRLQEAAEAGENLTPFVLEAVEARVTLGEISDALRAIYGNFQSLREF